MRPHIFLAPICHLVQWGISDPPYPLAHVHAPDVAKRRNGETSRQGKIDVGQRNFVQFFIPARTVKFNHLQHDIVNPPTRILDHLLHPLYCFLSSSFTVLLCFVMPVVLVMRVERAVR